MVLVDWRETKKLKDFFQKFAFSSNKWLKAGRKLRRESMRENEVLKLLFPSISPLLSLFHSLSLLLLVKRRIRKDPPLDMSFILKHRFKGTGRFGPFVRV